jgi:hypothetical protein
MGQEAKCKVTFDGKVSDGKAKLEPDALHFAGTFRLKIPLHDVKTVEAASGHLRVSFPDGTASFELGALAEKWMLKIRYPKNLLDKLGVKEASTVVVLNIDDEIFWGQLKARTMKISKSMAKHDADLVFYGAESKDDLRRLEKLERVIKRGGAIWVIAPKGKQHIKESDVLSASKEFGFVDTKVVSFSETHTGHKLVIPVARR